MSRKVIIDCFPESARSYRQGYAVVAVDVIRATTSAITVAAGGGRCFPVSSVQEAWRLASRFERPLLAGEVGGKTAPGFDLNNSPAALAERPDVSEPVILLSSSGTRLIHEAKGAPVIHLACLRNMGYLAAHLLKRACPRVAVIGAGSRNEFREEDQMCCSWIARDLIRGGYEPEDARTAALVERWLDEDPASIVTGNSARYLQRSGQLRDLQFILTHINDLEQAFVFENDEVVMIPKEKAALDPEPVSARADRPMPATL